MRTAVIRRAARRRPPKCLSGPTRIHRTRAPRRHRHRPQPLRRRGNRAAICPTMRPIRRCRQTGPRRMTVRLKASVTATRIGLGGCFPTALRSTKFARSATWIGRRLLPIWPPPLARADRYRQVGRPNPHSTFRPNWYNPTGGTTLRVECRLLARIPGLSFGECFDTDLRCQQHEFLLYRPAGTGFALQRIRSPDGFGPPARSIPSGRDQPTHPIGGVRRRGVR